jgi:hypothetical protein
MTPRIGEVIASIGGPPFNEQFQTEHIACRFADRDLMMRFHWGLAVGHAYTHDSTLAEAITATEECPDEVPDTEGSRPNAQVDVPSLELSEFSLNEHENHNWDSSEEEGEPVSDIDDETSDLDTF